MRESEVFRRAGQGRDSGWRLRDEMGQGSDDGPIGRRFCAEDSCVLARSAREIRRSQGTRETMPRNLRPRLRGSLPEGRAERIGSSPPTNPAHPLTTRPEQLPAPQPNSAAQPDPAAANRRENPHWLASYAPWLGTHGCEGVSGFARGDAWRELWPAASALALCLSI